MHTPIIPKWVYYHKDINGINFNNYQFNRDESKLLISSETESVTDILLNQIFMFMTLQLLNFTH